MIQKNLFDTIMAPIVDPAGLARHKDPDTSKEAARDLSTSKISNTVLWAVRKAVNGLTSEECATLTGLSLVTVLPRFRPLANRGLIRDSGERRHNASGKFAIVWKAVQP